MPSLIAGWRSETFLQKLEAEALAMEAEWQRQFVVYAILDPTLPDPTGRYGPGLPLYVGLTGNIGQRMRGHFAIAETARLRHYTVREQLARILAQGRIPVFIILGSYTKRLEMLKAETLWAQKLRHEGYPLANRHRDQCSMMRTDGLKKMLGSKVHAVPIAEAIATGISITASCSRCGHDEPVDLAQQQPVGGLPEPKLGKILARSPFCQACGKKTRYRIEDGVDPDGLVPGYYIGTQMQDPQRRLLSAARRLLRSESYMRACFPVFLPAE